MKVTVHRSISDHIMLTSHNPSALMSASLVMDLLVSWSFSEEIDKVKIHFQIKTYIFLLIKNM